MCDDALRHVTAAHLHLPELHPAPPNLSEHSYRWQPGRHLPCLLLTAIFVKIEFSPITFFTLTMIKIVFINSFGALLQGSLFGLAALFPASYTAPIMSGQGLAGTFAAFSMICALASGSALEDSAFGYFITACAVILLALLSYLALNKLEFYQFYTVENLRSAAISNANNVELKKDLLQAGKYFIRCRVFLLFNLFDWAGRSLTTLVMWPSKDSKLLPVMVAARLVFLPLFMLCNVKPRSHLPILLAHDAWYICIMVLFALSNGYLASLCMCFGPKYVTVFNEYSTKVDEHLQDFETDTDEPGTSGALQTQCDACRPIHRILLSKRRSFPSELCNAPKQRFTPTYGVSAYSGQIVQQLLWSNFSCYP
ncbi:unnamed protein product [Ranitomeya imitator]|uniref:Equilibrative nucleoside transporter 1 n=1 Tax=Ranitomeya imitator TaxID=111125 RepID=A0ABN9M6J3_9NEOB|nr:unnamed protein product [Ranitomeya imitator]